MKLMISGVQASAGTHTSPSFSRSLLSMMITGRPARNSSIASSTVTVPGCTPPAALFAMLRPLRPRPIPRETLRFAQLGPCCQQLVHVARQDVGLQVDASTRLPARQIRVLLRVLH